MTQSVGFAAHHSFTGLKWTEFEREDPRPNEVEIEVMYCGVCHSDIHQVKNDWGNTVYPCMPGHEVVGRVKSVGTGMTQHTVGDVVGVGCMIDSCRECEACKAGDQNYCEGPNSWLATYNGPMVPAKKSRMERTTMGGITRTEVTQITGGARGFRAQDSAGAGPQGGGTGAVRGGDDVLAAAALGCGAREEGRGHWLWWAGYMAVKLAKAMGAEVVVFTHTKEKVEEADRLGVTAVLETNLEEKQTLAKYKGRFDLLLSTIPKPTDLNPFLPLLKRDGAMVIVGALDELTFNNMVKASHRLSVAGSLIGNIQETQEVLNFCAEHGIAPDIEVIAMEEINDAHKRVDDGEVRFRYVIDMATLAKAS